jgi:hypothetical protein
MIGCLLWDLHLHVDERKEGGPNNDHWWRTNFQAERMTKNDYLSKRVGSLQDELF